jgi:hypothetical protein
MNYNELISKITDELNKLESNKYELNVTTTSENYLLQKMVITITKED